MQVLFTADWHIKLGQRNVPVKWQVQRFHMLVDRLNEIYKEHNCDLHIIGGDIFDRYSPTPEELELYFDLIANLEHPTIIFTGNHEMIDDKHSVLYNFADETKRCNSKVEVVRSIRTDEFDIIDYTDLKKEWDPKVSDLAFTHVRGEIPPHVKPEIDLSRFDEYSLVVAGDLHSFKNSQKTNKGTPIVYPGSPLTTSFHRERTKGSNGALLIDTSSLGYDWVELGDLPQLIRKKVSAGEDMVKSDYDRVIYEVEGDISELKSVKDSDLLDKKINKNVGKPPKLDMSNLVNTSEELSLFLKEVEGLPEEKVKELVSEYIEVTKDANNAS